MGNSTDVVFLFTDGSVVATAVPGVSKMTGATYTASWYLYEPGDDSVAKGRRASFEQVMRREQTRLASEGWEIEFAYQEAFDSEIGESFFYFRMGNVIDVVFFCLQRDPSPGIYRWSSPRSRSRWSARCSRSCIGRGRTSAPRRRRPSV